MNPLTSCGYRAAPTLASSRGWPVSIQGNHQRMRGEPLRSRRAANRATSRSSRSGAAGRSLAGPFVALHAPPARITDSELTQTEPAQVLDLQSVSTSQGSPPSQAGHDEPPQSMPVSSPPFFLSLQLRSTQTRLVASQSSLLQSEFWAHPFSIAHLTQSGPPQSTSVSVLSLTPLLQLLITQIKLSLSEKVASAVGALPNARSATTSAPSPADRLTTRSALHSTATLVGPVDSGSIHGLCIRRHLLPRQAPLLTPVA